MAPLPTYRVAAPDEYLALTGMGIDLVKISKSAWVYPFQRCTRFSVQPHDYAMNLQAMTKEKLQFLLPVVFTVGPDVNARGANAKTGVSQGQNHQQEDRGDSLMKYAMLLTDTNAKANTNTFLENIVKGIIEGETRVLVSSMTMEEIFTEREEFKRRIFRNIQSELDQFGLKIYNANVKELRDAPNSNYFESLARKAHEGAINQARIDVADAQQKGSVGEADRRGRQERELAKINAETAVQKTERDGERASAEASLDTRKTTLKRDLDIAKITATRATESRDAELKKEVEIKRAAAEMERLRAIDVVKASIAREAKQQAADARAYEVQVDATAQLSKTNQATDADAYKTRIGADAANYAALKDAEAKLQVQMKEAEGLTAMASAYGQMAQAFGGPAGLLQYMMIEKGTYVELANANAHAVQGMQPKISVWNTGSQAGGETGSSSSIDTMRNVYQMLPPLMQTINDQTGITLPEWQFGRLNNQAAELEKNKEIAKTNGDN
ncbi:flotillin domain-containing protein [Diaporthe amygdali]|uniref:flotillin domain-containing protein n=1 Tax=Phomopsis amygdali TaxID=1214568 RepID=UPI0022FE40AF|nr:flotillin domain-containing protein [Diaporthe amygdali]KAJ0124817.1 flotillin domain-containing protein [Diaporthe amygdali]